MRSVNSTVFLRFICSFFLLGLILLFFEYSLVFLHFSKGINYERIGAFSSIFALKDTLQRFKTTLGRTPTTAEYWILVIFLAIFAIIIQIILVLAIERAGRLPAISVHVWLTGFAIAAMMLGLVAFGYSGWKPFKHRNPNKGSISGKPE